MATAITLAVAGLLIAAAVIRHLKSRGRCTCSGCAADRKLRHGEPLTEYEKHILRDVEMDSMVDIPEPDRRPL